MPEIIQSKKKRGLGRGCCQLTNASQSQVVEMQIPFKFWEGISPEMGLM